MSKERVVLEGDMELRKGEGREGLVNDINISLMMHGGRLTPGVYRVSIVRVGPLPQAEEKA